MNQATWFFVDVFIVVVVVPTTGRLCLSQSWQTSEDVPQKPPKCASPHSPKCSTTTNRWHRVTRIIAASLACARAHTDTHPVGRSSGIPDVLIAVSTSRLRAVENAFTCGGSGDPTHHSIACAVGAHCLNDSPNRFHLIWLCVCARRDDVLLLTSRTHWASSYARVGQWCVECIDCLCEYRSQHNWFGRCWVSDR